MEVHGDWDCAQELYRVFECREHVDEFLAGKIRFGNIRSYTGIEDNARKDSSEGVSHSLVGDKIIRSAFTCGGNHHYICCFHRTRDAAERSGFGRFIVKFNEPRKIANSVLDKLEKMSGFLCGVEGVAVRYNKGEVDSEFPEKSPDIVRLAYSQKPRDPYESEKEFRMVINSKSDLGTYYIVDIEKPLDYCEIISDFRE